MVRTGGVTLRLAQLTSSTASLTHQASRLRGGLMAEFIAGMLIGSIIGLFIAADVSITLKKEAFDRGFMVQCVGKTGYYWECE
jgi:uncharacterized membrane protein YfcA